MTLQSQPLGFKWYRSTTGKGIVEGWKFVGVEQFSSLRMIAIKFACFSPTFTNLLTGFREHRFVVGVLPLHQPADDAKQAFALDLCLLLIDPTPKAALIARIIDHLRKDHGSRCRKRPACPPEMQCGRVAMANRLFTSSSLVDIVQRKCNFDEFFGCLNWLHCFIPSPLLSCLLPAWVWMTEATPHHRIKVRCESGAQQCRSRCLLRHCSVCVRDEQMRVQHQVQPR